MSKLTIAIVLKQILAPFLMISFMSSIIDSVHSPTVRWCHCLVACCHLQIGMLYCYW